MSLTLAASGPGGGGLLREVWPWLVALLLLVCVGAIAIYVVRRTLDRETTPDEGFSLQDLRELHASGALTDEEFDRAKAAIIGRLAGDDEPEA